MTNVNPAGWHTVTPRIVVEDPAGLVAFLKRGRDPGDRPETVDVPRLFGIASLVVVGNSIEVAQEETLPIGLELRTRTATGSKRDGQGR